MSNVNLYLFIVQGNFWLVINDYNCFGHKFRYTTAQKYNK